MLETFAIYPGTSTEEPEPIKPGINVVEATDRHARVALEPLAPGLAHTIGNPLRRYLLSSIKGSAITWVKIEDMLHQYTAIPGIKEEVMELLLNIKRIRIRSQTGRTGKMRLEVRGEGRVCAGDIATSSEFEIVNPELHLATLDDAELTIEFNVESGVGYRPAEPSEGGAGLQVGQLPVDAIFNPVRKVNYSLERTRVGQQYDYERLVLELWTDGTIDPIQAMRQAADALVEDLFLFKNLSSSADTAGSRQPLGLSPEVYQTPIERLELSPRTLNCLKRAHITRVGEVLEKSDDELLKIRNFGERSLSELREKLADKGIGSNASRANFNMGLSAEPMAYADERDTATDDDADADPTMSSSLPGVESIGADSSVATLTSPAVSEDDYDDDWDYPDDEDDDQEENC